MPHGCAGDAVKAKEGVFDKMNPDNVAAVVAYLASPSCRFTGRVFGIVGSHLALYEGWSVNQHFDNEVRWSIADLKTTLANVPLQVHATSQSIPGAIPHASPADDVLAALEAFD